MPLPPLSNLFALHDPDPAALAAFERDLQSSGEFAQLWRPAPGWVCAIAPLPQGIPDDAALDGLIQQHGLAFAEGRERLVDDQPHPEEAVRRLLELADHRPDNLASLTPGRTFLKGVRLLERGYYAQIGSNGHSQNAPYWNPRPTHIPYPGEDMQRELHPAGGNLMTLSGGVDSSSLTALAGGAAGRELMLFSLIPRAERHDLVAHEMSFIEPLAEKYGFDRRWAVNWYPEIVLDLWLQAPPVENTSPSSNTSSVPSS